jgi:hypothetical protein
MFNTLALDQTAWDLIMDSSRNIAMVSPPYALAQDIASAVKLFLAELWYDTTRGIPYWTKILGKLPPTALVIQYIVQAALTVSGVVSAQCVINSFNARTITGQIIFVDESGKSTTVQFSGPDPPTDSISTILEAE